MKKWFINVPDQNLAYLVQGTDHFDDYCEALRFAQQFAQVNRDIMMDRTLKAMQAELGITFNSNVEAVSCHHNYVAWERHFGDNCLVTRKGAVRAQEGDLCIIPGAMGKQSFICRGKGNRDSFNSCSHGAGRLMSRTEAKKRFTLDDHAEATKGVECRKDADVIDETPAAYKSLADVMSSQNDLIEVVHTLRAILNIKG
jgi:tRNA-splicing ligase RtcB